jgi:integrase
MSVYKPAKSPFYHYDFRFKGRRYYGSTGCQTPRKAEAVERRRREDVALGRADPVSGPGALTLDEACGRWWIEHGQRRRDADDAQARLERLLTFFPANIKLSEIDQAAVARAIETRRGKLIKRGPKGRAWVASNGTVNRDVIAVLRPVLRRAATHWMETGAPALPQIDWRSLHLSEPREHTRVYPTADLAAWRAECGPVEQLALDLMATYGFRFGEVMFKPSVFEPEGPRLHWMKGRKGDVPHTVPLLPHHVPEIAARVGRAVKADLPHLFFVEEVDKRRKLTLRALTRYELKGALLRAAARAGIAPGRIIHSLRHHAGTQILRASGGSLKAAQRLLGHADIKSTQRYAHMLEDDLRTALEKMATLAPEEKAGRA